MATLNIVEFPQIREANGTVAQIPQKELAIQNLTFSTEAKCNAFQASTGMVRLVSTVDCFILMGNDPTVSTTTGIKLLAGQPEYFGVPDGKNLAVDVDDLTYKISAIAA